MLYPAESAEPSQQVEDEVADVSSGSAPNSRRQQRQNTPQLRQHSASLTRRQKLLEVVNQGGSARSSRQSSASPRSPYPPEFDGNSASPGSTGVIRGVRSSFPLIPSELGDDGTSATPPPPQPQPVTTPHKRSRRASPAAHTLLREQQTSSPDDSDAHSTPRVAATGIHTLPSPLRSNHNHHRSPQGTPGKPPLVRPANTAMTAAEPSGNLLLSTSTSVTDGDEAVPMQPAVPQVRPSPAAPLSAERASRRSIHGGGDLLSEREEMPMAVNTHHRVSHYLVNEDDTAGTSPHTRPEMAHRASVRPVQEQEEQRPMAVNTHHRASHYLVNEDDTAGTSPHTRPEMAHRASVRPVQEQEEQRPMAVNTHHRVSHYLVNEDDTAGTSPHTRPEMAHRASVRPVQEQEEQRPMAVNTHHRASHYLVNEDDTAGTSPHTRPEMAHRASVRSVQEQEEQRPMAVNTHHRVSHYLVNEDDTAGTSPHTRPEMAHRASVRPVQEQEEQRPMAVNTHHRVSHYLVNEDDTAGTSPHTRPEMAHRASVRPVQEQEEQRPMAVNTHHRASHYLVNEDDTAGTSPHTRPEMAHRASVRSVQEQEEQRPMAVNTHHRASHYLVNEDDTAGTSPHTRPEMAHRASVRPVQSEEEKAVAVAVRRRQSRHMGGAAAKAGSRRGSLQTRREMSTQASIAPFSAEILAAAEHVMAMQAEYRRSIHGGGAALYEEGDYPAGVDVRRRSSRALAGDAWEMEGAARRGSRHAVLNQPAVLPRPASVGRPAPTISLRRKEAVEQKELDASRSTSVTAQRAMAVSQPLRAADLDGATHTPPRHATQRVSAHSPVVPSRQLVHSAPLPHVDEESSQDFDGDEYPRSAVLRQASVAPVDAAHAAPETHTASARQAQLHERYKRALGGEDAAEAARTPEQRMSWSAPVTSARTKSLPSYGSVEVARQIRGFYAGGSSDEDDEDDEDVSVEDEAPTSPHSSKSATPPLGEEVEGEGAATPYRAGRRRRTTLATAVDVDEIRPSEYRLDRPAAATPKRKQPAAAAAAAVGEDEEEDEEDEMISCYDVSCQTSQHLFTDYLAALAKEEAEAANGNSTDAQLPPPVVPDQPHYRSTNRWMCALGLCPQCHPGRLNRTGAKEGTYEGSGSAARGKTAWPIVTRGSLGYSAPPRLGRAAQQPGRHSATPPSSIGNAGGSEGATGHTRLPYLATTGNRSASSRTVAAPHRPATTAARLPSTRSAAAALTTRSAASGRRPRRDVYTPTVTSYQGGYCFSPEWESRQRQQQRERQLRDLHVEQSARHGGGNSAYTPRLLTSHDMQSGLPMAEFAYRYCNMATEQMMVHRAAGVGRVKGDVALENYNDTLQGAPLISRAGAPVASSSRGTSDGTQEETFLALADAPHARRMVRVSDARKGGSNRSTSSRHNTKSSNGGSRARRAADRAVAVRSPADGSSHSRSPATARA